MKTDIKCSAETKVKSEWRLLCKEESEMIRAIFGFHYIPGNDRPYFSITADIAEPAAPHNRRETRVGIEGKEYAITGGGCCHDDIVRVFPQYAELIPWHLVSDNAEPLHYLANAKYWIEKHFGIFKTFPFSEPEGKRKGDPEPLEAFKRTIVLGAVEDDKQLEQILASEPGEPKDIPDLTKTYTERKAEKVIPMILAWLEQRSTRLQPEMVKIMRRFNVEYIDILTDE